jgi:hypothetical protein
MHHAAADAQIELHRLHIDQTPRAAAVRCAWCGGVRPRSIWCFFMCVVAFALGIFQQPVVAVAFGFGRLIATSTKLKYSVPVF